MDPCLDMMILPREVYGMGSHWTSHHTNSSQLAPKHKVPIATVIMRVLVWTSCLLGAVQAFLPSNRAVNHHQVQAVSVTSSTTQLWSTYEDEAPSDFNTEDLEGEKSLNIDENEEDAVIRDALKRELLLLSSITNRGEYASADDQNVITDLVAQLEALNPTQDPARNCEGEWDLAMSSTPFFQSSPFFQSIRVALGDKAMAENAFDLHDRVTTPSRIGRVRQTITNDELVSEVDLEVGLPGLPVRIKGTVVSTASWTVRNSELAELQIRNTSVRGSNVPLFNEVLDNLKFELPVGSLYSQLQGSVPIVPCKTFYLDEGMRITRDMDDNFYVFTRA